jgi:hypothetical protein
LPGHCGLLNFLLFERDGPLANAGLRRSGSSESRIRSQYW